MTSPGRPFCGLFKVLRILDIRTMATRTPRRQQLDLHELQRRELLDDMAQDEIALQRRPAAPRGHNRAAPPGRAALPGRAAPPGRSETPRGLFAAPYRRETFAQFPPPTEAVRAAEQGWEQYADTPPDPPYDEPPARRPGAGRRNERGIGIDVHELLKQEAYGLRPSYGEPSEKDHLGSTGVYGVSDQYMVLDSFNKLRSSRIEQGEFKFNFMVQGVTGDEVIGVRDRIDAVTEIQMTSFTLPILQEVPYVLRNAPPAPTGTNQLVLIKNNINSFAGGAPILVPNNFPTGGQYPNTVLTINSPFFTVPWINNPYSQVPFGNRLTVQLVEAGLQSFSDRKGARHHFEFILSYFGQGSASNNPTMLQALPLSGSQWDTFSFTDPLKDVHGLTLVFRNPDQPVSFLPDVLYDVDVVSDGAASPGPFLRFDYQDHGLQVGDRIYVSGFNSGNPVLDSYVNRESGHVASGNPSLPPENPGAYISTPNSFWTDPAISIIDMTAPAPILPQLVTVYIAKRRVRIPIRFRGGGSRSSSN